MRGRITRATPFAALSLLTLVLAHNLVFVVGYGAAYREMLSRTGHGDPWRTAVLVVLGLGLGLAVAASMRIAALWHQARSLAQGPLGPIAQPSFLPGLLSLWLRLGLSGAGLFTIQENVERLGTVGSGAIGDLPGVAVLGAGGHPDAIVVIAAVAGAVALVGQLFHWHRAVLIARLAAARARLPRALATGARPFEHLGPRPTSILGRRLAVRAPPLA